MAHYDELVALANTSAKTSDLAGGSISFWYQNVTRLSTEIVFTSLAHWRDFFIDAARRRQRFVVI